MLVRRWGFIILVTFHQYGFLQAPNESKDTPTHVSPATGQIVKHRETQVEMSAKPVPAPRRKADNSLKTGSATANPESDDEIVEIRFEDEPHNQVITRHATNAASGRARHRTPSRRTLHGRSQSTELDERSAGIKRSMDELRKREQDESEITRDLEKQLAEIRRLEERQRNILQNTLRQVVHSVNDSQTSLSKPVAPSDEETIRMDSRIDYSSLLSPSFNRKTPLSSPSFHRPAASSPQSPRKHSTPSARRKDMHTISENGGYSITELAAMSPASSHRTLSNMASPILPPRELPRPYETPRVYSGGSHSLPPRSALSQEALQPGLLADPYSDINFRLSASYTELLPRREDRSGYFSDRESDRRRGGDELKSYTDEARRALLQFEIERRRKQVEENNLLRHELQRFIQAGSIPASQYDRLREMYKEHINRSREYLRLSNSSLSSVATTLPRGFDYSDSETYMSSTEHLSGALSQSSTVDFLMQSSESLVKLKPNPGKVPPPTNVSTMSITQETVTVSSTSTMGESATPAREGENLPAMPLLDIKTPKSTSQGSSELVKVGKSSKVSTLVTLHIP